MLLGRRVRFAMLVLASQLLLTALAAVMLVQMLLVGANGRVYFVEGNRAILWMEIAATTLITAFGLVVFGIQLRRLGERRNSDRPGSAR